MADENFDPYYTWLGIRPEEQPPDHYRLIGLRQFEENADVIANAADRQMQFLRSMQVGKRSALSQKLLNEISAAGGCLLDPDRKTKYDQELKAKAKAAAAKAKPIPKAASLQPIPKPAPLAAKLPEPDLFSIMPQNAYVAPVQPAQRPSAQATANLPLILGGAAGGIVLLLIVVIVAGKMLSGGKPTVVKLDNGQKNGTPAVEGSVQPSTGKAPAPPAVTTPPVASKEKEPEKEVITPTATVSAAPNRAKDWQYGLGEFDEQSKRVTTFTPLRYWTGNWWQVGRDCPDPEHGWVYVDRLGGSIGNTLKDSAVRRWTAPQAGKLSITGEFEHFHVGKMGDGVRGRIVSSRSGAFGEWKLRYASDKTNVENVEVHAGDKIDLIADCLEDPFCDTFRWPVVLRLSDAQGKELGTWSSAEDFRGMLPGESLTNTEGPGFAKPPMDPNWKPPTADSQAAFRSVLGRYMYSLDRAKTYPYVNLQVPRKNLWSPSVEEKVRGKVPYDEISYVGIAKIAVPSDGTYVWDAEKAGRLQIDGKVVAELDTPKGEVKLAGGVHELIYEIGSHGGNWMRETNLGLRHKETGEEVPFFNTWQDIQKFLATPIAAQRVTEVSGWQPTQENELKIDPQLLASGGIKTPLTHGIAGANTRPAARVAVPDEATRSAAKNKVASIFESELKGAKTPAQKHDLAKSLLAASATTTDPAERYVLLSESRRLATEAKDLSGAMSALDSLGSDYEIDLVAEKAKLMQGLSGGTLTPALRSELVTAVCEAGHEALAADNLEAVTTLVAAARSLATKATSDSKAEAKEFTDLAAQRQKRMETLRKAEQTLAATPDNAAANLVVGLHTFFVRGMEKEGLTMLAKGNDVKLAVAAKTHADNVAKGTETSAEEADAWYDAIATVPADYKVNVQRKALEAYTLLASSGTGLAKAKAEKRRQELAAALPIGDSQPTKRLKMSDVPEKSPGMVGRVLVDGKDAGILVTTQPQHELDENKLAAILTQVKVKRARLVFIGTFHCDTAGEFRAWHLGREGGLAQVISMDGKPFSFAGGTYDRGGDHRINIPAGDHLIQWIIDFDLSSKPALQTYFGTPQKAEKFDVFTTRRQLFEARKIPTNMEIDVSK